MKDSPLLFSSDPPIPLKINYNLNDKLRFSGVAGNKPSEGML